MVSYFEKGPRSNPSTQIDAHLNTTAFWRDRSNRLEAKIAALEAEATRLRASIFELEQRELVWKQKSAEVADSPRLQRLKRRRNVEPAEEHGSRSTKQARTQAVAVTVSERDQMLQNLISHETGSEMDELGE